MATNSKMIMDTPTKSCDLFKESRDPNISLISFNTGSVSDSVSITDARGGSNTIYKLGDHIKCYSINECVNETTPTYTIREIVHNYKSKELWMGLVSNENKEKRTIACADYYFRHVEKQEAPVTATVDGESDYENKAFCNAVDKFNREFEEFRMLRKKTEPHTTYDCNNILYLFNLYSINGNRDKENKQLYRCKMENLIELLMEERRKFSEKREKEILEVLKH